MKKAIKSLISIAGLGLILVISISCDNDFTNIESDIQGTKNFEATSKLFPFVAKTQNFTPFTASGAIDAVGIQTNGLNGSLFGIYNNPTPAFGTTVASVTTQVLPLTYNPDFGTVNRTVESVWLNIPYFATIDNTDADGNNTYTLDSVIGDISQGFKLSIYRNNHVLRDLDPNLSFQSPQCYYSNQGVLFESNSSPIGDLIYQDLNFKISADEYPIQELDDTGALVFDTNGDPVYTERIPPGIRLNLLKSNPTDTDTNRAFWENIFFINQGNATLSTQSNFKDFFRGLIIKVEPITSTPSGSLTYLNFNTASILFDYTNQEEIDANTAGNPFDDSEVTVYRLEFNGNTVNTFEQINAVDHNGDQDNLYLQGAEGSMAVLDLFSGNILNDDGILVPTFNYFYGKKDKWLINEANLVFYVNQSLVSGGDDEPNRITLYDLKNNTPIIDYFIDGSTNTIQPTLSKTSYSEVLERNVSGDGVKYKIRLTAHISNILQRDSTNVKLGLFIANNVNNQALSKIQGTNNDADDNTLDVVPSTSVLSPKATVLHGYDSNPATPLRAEFEIFYTEPEN